MTRQSSDTALKRSKSLLGEMGYIPYPVYKDSGVEWLGQTPAHWEVKKAVHMFSVGSGGTPSTDHAEHYDGDIAWVTTSDLCETVVTSTKKSITEEALRIFSAIKVYPEDSVIIAMYAGANIGRLGILGIPAAVNQACCVFSDPKEADARFWFYWLHARRSYLVSLGCGGAQSNLSRDLLKSISIPMPSLPEQCAIAKFLDHETLKIDTLVEKQERLIDLLQERRAALISHVVSKGLDPNVPMKNSGIEWLGKIPAHWDIVAVKRQFSIQLGKMLQNDPASSEDVEVPYLKARHVQWFSVSVSLLPTMWASPKELEKYGIRPGDLIVCEGGEGGRCGIAGNVPHNCIIQNALHRVREINVGESKVGYLQYVINAVSLAKWFEVTNSKATIGHFTKDNRDLLNYLFRSPLT